MNEESNVFQSFPKALDFLSNLCIIQVLFAEKVNAGVGFLIVRPARKWQGLSVIKFDKKENNNVKKN